MASSTLPPQVTPPRFHLAADGPEALDAEVVALPVAVPLAGAEGEASLVLGPGAVALDDPGTFTGPPPGPVDEPDQPWSYGEGEAVTAVVRVDGDQVLLGPPFVITDDELARVVDVVGSAIEAGTGRAS